MTHSLTGITSFNRVTALLFYLRCRVADAWDMMDVSQHFLLSSDPIEPGVLAQGLQDSTAGAILTFEGRVRNHNSGREVVRLEYQVYATLAIAVGNAIVEEEMTRSGLVRAIAVQRVGGLEIGEIAVWVGASSAHREQAFEAVTNIVERLKYELPIWKKETYSDNSTEWVGPDNKSAVTGRSCADS